MISSGAMAGTDRSIAPKPASRAIGVKLSLLCAAAARARTDATSIAKDHLFFIVATPANLSPVYKIRRRCGHDGLFQNQGQDALLLYGRSGGSNAQSVDSWMLSSIRAISSVTYCGSAGAAKYVGTAFGEPRSSKKQMPPGIVVDCVNLS